MIPHNNKNKISEFDKKTQKRPKKVGKLIKKRLKSAVFKENKKAGQ
jgi:hypothetical protein